MRKKILCDSCRRNMSTKDRTSLVGIAITLKGELVKEVYPEIKVGYEYKICFVCWLKSLGVKFK